jgi:hypothetical protein
MIRGVAKPITLTARRLDWLKRAPNSKNNPAESGVRIAARRQSDDVSTGIISI